MNRSQVMMDPNPRPRLMPRKIATAPRKTLQKMLVD